jgi:hypothetical protein
MQARSSGEQVSMQTSDHYFNNMLTLALLQWHTHKSTDLRVYRLIRSCHANHIIEISESNEQINSSTRASENLYRLNR